MAEKHCGCGQKTKNASGICDKCLANIRALNRIRSLLGVFPFNHKPKKKKVVTEEYLAYPPKGYHDQLCWYCENACGGCSWSESFIPVEGWEAIKTGESYHITFCPQYQPLKMRREVLK